MAEELGADYLELANTQYYGWAHANRDLLMPTQATIRTGRSHRAGLQRKSRRQNEDLLCDSGLL